jgi:hypothetical protein
MGCALSAGALCAFALPATVSAQAQPPADPATARLQGEFQMLGRVTVAQNIRGERRGEKAKRIWRFTSACAVGQCRTVRLVRHRAGGVDRVTLKRHGAGYYTGTGVFYAPLRCASQEVRRGEAVPFRLTLRITGGELSTGIDIASAVQATYTNGSRRNLTRCVAIPGHDAAVYSGTFMTLPSPPPTSANAQSPGGS